MRRFVGVVALVLVVTVAGLPSLSAQEVQPRDVIAYDRSVEPGMGPMGVATIRADGSDQQLLTDPEWGTPQPVWSPDGRHLAFQRSYRLASDDGAVIEIVVMDWDGSDRRVVWSVEHLDVAPQPGFGPLAWSPDGFRIAFSYDGLRTLDVATGAVQRLTTPPAGWSDSDPSWSPENDAIAFTRAEVPSDGDDYDQLSQVHVVTVASGRTRRLVEDGSQPRWSPDGQWIAFNGDDLVRPDGSGRRELGGAIWSVSWSPDGRQLSYSNHDGVWTVSVADGTRVQLAGTSDMSMGTSWSADARQVAYAGGGPEQGLWVASAAGQATPRLLDLNGFSPRFSPGITSRLAGPSRVDTAVTISRATFSQAGTVVLARADVYPDALAGAPLAAKHQAPLLLTAQDRLQPAVAEELRRLEVDTAYLLGSEAALAAQVEQDVRDLGIATVRRLGGSDRFDTARVIAAEVGGDAVFIVEGAHAQPDRGWPDAVAVSGLAASRQQPILLVERNRLPPATGEALTHLDPSSITIVGGEAAVSAQVEQELAAGDGNVSRLAGASRYATSAAVADAALAEGIPGRSVWLATGRNWPDALSAGPAAAAHDGVLLLVDPRSLSDSEPVRDWITEHHGEIEGVRLVGGPTAIGADVAVQVERAE